MNNTNQLTRLNQHLLDAAQAFAGEQHPLDQLLIDMAQDVDRAMQEPLELFPVCHHSPSSALHMVQRLYARQQGDTPLKVIYMEMCEDMRGMLGNLRDCTLPVALQAFAAESDILPAEQLPVAVVAPLTEASAEYQAIAYALQHPETRLVFVDRAADYVFQWGEYQRSEDKDAAADEQGGESEPPAPSEEAQMHGSAIGVQAGDLRPSFDQFLHFLLRNANTRHYAEWWDQYVEQAIIGADYAIYRQVMFLIGSLIRRLGSRADHIQENEQRERYMWTRIKQDMQQHNIAPDEAMFICGAAHTASYVDEFGVNSPALWDIPDRSATKWQYGLIPSSFAAIEYQFHHPAGTVKLAKESWQKSLRTAKLKPFVLESEKKSKKRKARKMTTVSLIPTTSPEPDTLATFLQRPPELQEADHEQLLDWCVNVVYLARKNGYLASTADSIAIYETAIMLANMRNRQHPTPYDFQDAAITCLEKDRTPKKRNIAQICQILLGGDQIGTVGYTALPPLAQDVYDRLKPLGVNLTGKTNQRALMDFKKYPELLDCSEVLWRLNYLLGNYTVQPIMGERTLPHNPIQESWEIRIGKYQRSLIQLGYEAVTLEQVMEKRMKKVAFGDQATAHAALAVTEDSVRYLDSPRLTAALGQQATNLLLQETGATDAPAIFERIRRLVHYYRATPNGLPTWIEQFVTTGYAHYTTLLPQSFADQGTTPTQIGGMLGFILTLESLALTLGCQRSQLTVSIQQVQSEATHNGLDPAKAGLLWTTEWLLDMRSLDEIRTFFQEMLDNPLRLPAFPDYLNGFILALNFAPRITGFVVELLSSVFANVPDKMLMPWLPSLLLQLRQHKLILQPLVKEASAIYPKSLRGFTKWTPPWVTTKAQTSQHVPSAQQASLSPTETTIHNMLFSAPETANVMAGLLGVHDGGWTQVVVCDVVDGSDNGLVAHEETVQRMLLAAPETMNVFASRLSP
ncbi:MAG: DUF5682 family protein [Chloroflexota bacterium]